MSRRKHGCKILILDIETMYAIVHTWSLWPKFISPNDVIEPVSTICWAAMWDHERSTMFGRMDDPGSLDRIYNLIDEADAIVTYNGVGFDAKHLNKDFVLAGYHPPSGYHHIDLYLAVKKQFKFQSNKLDYVIKQLGGRGKKPHEGMGLWDKVRAGDAMAWRKMEAYNRQDVKETKWLYHRILPWIHNHPNVGMWIVDPAKPTCTHCGSMDLIHKGAQYNTKSQSYLRYKCNNCGTPLRGRFTIRPRDRTVLTRTP